MPTFTWSRAAPLAALTLLLACGEERHYAVNLRGEARRVDADGNPLAGESLPAADGEPVRGTVQLDPALGIDPSGFACMFVTATPVGATMSAAAIKIDQPQFPADFVLGGSTAHGSGLAGGEYRVQAWLDADGDASKQPGDVIGFSSRAVRPGGEPAVVVLAHVLTAEDLPTTAPGALPAAPHPAPSAPSAPSAPFAGGAGPAPTPADLAGPRFKGSVELAPEFADLNGLHTLYIMLRSPQTEGGMPLAVKRVDGARFPLSFDIGTESVPLDVENKAEMIGGQVKVTARLSVSGKLGGGPGDIESVPLVTEPSSDLVLRLDTRRTQ